MTLPQGLGTKVRAPRCGRQGLGAKVCRWVQSRREPLRVYRVRMEPEAAGRAIAGRRFAAQPTGLPGPPASPDTGGPAAGTARVARLASAQDFPLGWGH